MRWRSAALVALLVASPGLSILHSQGGLSILDVARVTLNEQPSIKLADERLAASRGDEEQAESRFDVQFDSSFDKGRFETPNTAFDQQFTLLPPSSVTDVSTLKGTVTRSFRTGQTVSAGATLDRTDVGLNPPPNRGTVSVLFAQPLLRGRDSRAVMAGVRAAQLNVDSAAFDARHLRAASVLQSSIAYWNYLAAVRRVGVFQESEALARQIADQTRVLIGAGMRPAVDEKQVDANVANSISQRIGGEQAVYQARYDLGIAMGLGFADMGTLPLPSDPFPDVPSDRPSLDALATIAIANRNDLHSRERLEQSSSQQLIAARDDVKRKLDLTANAGYSGLSEGAEIWRYLNPLAVRPTGPNVTVGLAFSAFRSNHAALGRLTRSQSELNQAELQTFDLRRGILASVAVAYNNLQAAALRLESSREASLLYRSAVDDQRQLQQMGVATILDLINTQSRLTQSALDELTAQQDFAIALTQVRFETATLIDDSGQPSPASLTALPR